MSLKQEIESEWGDLAVRSDCWLAAGFLFFAALQMSGLKTFFGLWGEHEATSHPLLVVGGLALNTLRLGVRTSMGWAAYRLWLGPIEAVGCFVCLNLASGEIIHFAVDTTIVLHCLTFLVHWEWMLKNPGPVLDQFLCDSTTLLFAGTWLFLCQSPDVLVLLLIWTATGKACMWVIICAIWQRK